MRSRHGAVVAGAALALALALAGGAVADTPAHPGSKGQPAASAPGSGSWFERSWQRVLQALGLGAGGKARWTAAELSAPGGCGSYGCACCHSSIMEVGRIDDAYVHPGQDGSGQGVDELYLRAAKAITKMNPIEREQLRRRIRNAIGNRDTAGADKLIEGAAAR